MCLCVCLCVSMCMCVHVYICGCPRVSPCMHAFLCGCICVCVCLCVPVCAVYIPLSVSVSVSVSGSPSLSVSLGLFLSLCLHLCAIVSATQHTNIFLPGCDKGWREQPTGFGRTGPGDMSGDLFGAPSQSQNQSRRPYVGAAGVSNWASGRNTISASRLHHLNQRL